MIGKFIGAATGAAVGNATGGMSGAKGAIVGTLAVSVARRMGLAGLVAAGAGAYFLGKRARHKDGVKAAGKAPPRRASPASPPAV